MTPRAAKPYARALYELARERDQVDAIARDLAALAAAVDADRDLRAVLERPWLSADVRRQVALDVAGTRRVWLSGPATGHLPFRPESAVARVLMPFIGRVIFHRMLTTSPPIGRKVRPKMLARGDPLIRIKPKDLAAVGVERVPRTTGVEGGLPRLEDGRRLGRPNARL